MAEIIEIMIKRKQYVIYGHHIRFNLNTHFSNINLNINFGAVPVFLIMTLPFESDFENNNLVLRQTA